MRDDRPIRRATGHRVGDARGECMNAEGLTHPPPAVLNVLAVLLGEKALDFAVALRRFDLALITSEPVDELALGQQRGINGQRCQRDP
ncbi:MAG: hypothetical protein ABI224_04755 [Acetobacteraceae bacterium]